ncbi:hypothetical protein N1851_023529 [Merluccius polli]|uniref:Uncharacterized protein n=1 Tax=Merluccius polli TaxID=89951 RepID=A0AA47MG92_MERPO|nr:hypothetical protein N1851_023529 [Merluccius polli]
MKARLPLPTCLLINAQSLRGKADELTANVRYMHEYRGACMLAVTETWLDGNVPSNEVEPTGYTLYRADRDPGITGKTSGGGVGLFIRDDWCWRGSVVVRESLCTPDIELLSLPPLGASDHNVVHLRPVYQRLLEREKPQTRTVKIWNEDSIMALQGCFDCTSWEVFKCPDLNEQVEVISDYIVFCENSVVPTKSFKIINSRMETDDFLKPYFYSTSHNNPTSLFGPYT